MALGEGLIDDRPSVSSAFKARNKYTKEEDSLDSVVEATMNEGSKVVLNHPVHSFGENGIFFLEKFVARISPLLDRLFNELSCNNEWVVIRELSCLGPVLDLSGRTARGVKFSHCSAIFITSST